MTSRDGCGRASVLRARVAAPGSTCYATSMHEHTIHAHVKLRTFKHYVIEDRCLVCGDWRVRRGSRPNRTCGDTKCVSLRENYPARYPDITDSREVEQSTELRLVQCVICGIWKEQPAWFKSPTLTCGSTHRSALRRMRARGQTPPYAVPPPEEDWPLPGSAPPPPSREVCLKELEQLTRTHHGAQIGLHMLTEALPEHPEGWEGPCACRECKEAAT